MPCQKKGFCCQQSIAVTDQDDNPVPMDRGWAWVIVFASAGLFGLIAGTFKCFGILKLEIQNNFGEEDCGEDITLWVFSACSIISLISGLPFGWLVGITTHRAVGMIGGTLCSAGIFLTAFAPNCEFMFFSFALVYAVGAGGVMVVAFSAFAGYFSRHKGLAVGVMASGSGLGSLVVPKLLRTFFEVFSFRDALICYAGVFLHTIVLSALIRPTSYYQALPKRIRKPKSTDGFNDCNAGEEDTKFLAVTSLDKIISVSQSSISKKLIMDDLELSSLHKSVPCSLDNNNRLGDSQLTSAELTQIYGSGYFSIAAPFISTHSLNELSNGNKHSATETGNVTTITSSTAANRKSKSPTSYNWRLWLDRQVLLIGMLVFFAVNSINLIFTTTPSFAQEEHVEVDVVTTIMTLAGIGEIACRILHGWLADRRIFSALTQICIIMLCCTIASILCATLHGVSGIGIMYAVMSLCGTTIYSLLPIVIIEQIGKEHLVAVLGIFYFFQAIAFVVSTLVATKLFAVYKTWVVVFYYIGACYLMAFIIGIFTLVYFSRFVKRLLKRQTVTATLA